MLNASKIPTHIEHVDLLYDKNSSDSKLNWGKTSGIPHSTTVSGKDFNKYDRLRVYISWSGNAFAIYEIDMHTLTDDLYQAGSPLISACRKSDTDHYWAIVYTNSAKTSFSCDATGYDSFSKRTTNSTTAFVVYKIEGIYGGGHSKLSLWHRIFHRGGAVC